MSSAPSEPRLLQLPEAPEVTGYASRLGLRSPSPALRLLLACTLHMEGAIGRGVPPAPSLQHMLLGLLAAAAISTGRAPNVPAQNALEWLGDWIKLNQPRAFAQLEVLQTNQAYRDSALESALFKAAIRITTDDCADAAQKLARETGGRDRFELRHLVIILLCQRQTRDIFGLAGLDWNLVTREDVIAHLVANILMNPIRSETPDRWALALEKRGLPRAASAVRDSSGPARPARRTVAGSKQTEPGPGMSGPSPSAGDVTAQGEAPAQGGAPAGGGEAGAGGGLVGFSTDLQAPPGDLLQTGADATALARLLALQGVSPLALAVFGDWGAGKTTFMGQLEQALDREIAADGGVVFVRKVLHVRFNAWQFADANLWASLTAEFFDQLRAGGHARLGDVRMGRLVQEVNARVHALTSEIERARAAAASSQDDVRAKTRVREDAARDARTGGSKVLAQRTLDAVFEIAETNRAALNRLGLGRTDGPLPGDALATIRQTAKSAGGLFGTAGAAAVLLAKKPWLLGLVAVLGIVGLGAAVWSLVAILQGQDFGPAIGRAIGALAALGGALKTAGPALAVARATAGRLDDILAAGDAADTATAKAEFAAEAELRAATAEAQARQAALARAEAALARYISPEEGSAPASPRLLRYVLEDDPRSKALEGEIGLIGRARRLFEAVDDILCRNLPTEPGGTPPDPDLPDRIVITIDDLDRCSFEKVYAVLQAVHLLLAFRSFVVVVGVDPGWVKGALESAIASASGQPPGAPQAPDSARAEHYLEKIFQLAIQLRPLAAGADGQGTFRSLVGTLARTTGAAAQPAPLSDASSPVTVPEAGAQDGPPATAGAASQTTGTGPGGNPALQRPDPSPALPPAPLPPPPPTSDQVRDWMTLDEQEVAFLSGPLMASLCAPTPRTAKRLVNTYRVLRSQRAAQVPSGGPDGPRAHAALALATVLACAARPGLLADAVATLTSLAMPGPPEPEPPYHVGHVRLFGGLVPSEPASPFLSALLQAPDTDLDLLRAVPAGELLQLIDVARRFAIRFPDKPPPARAG